MTRDEAEAYLARIGFRGPLGPDVATLRALHRAHLHAVPFENLDIHLGRPIRLDRRALFAKVVGERRGGFCYELNALFADLLAFAGFPVSLLSARVARKAGGFGPEHDHLALLVEAGGRFLADVGFGRSYHEPLSLDAPREEEAEGYTYRAVEVEGGWQVQSRRGEGWTPEVAFSLAPYDLAAFEAMCAYHQTSPASPFTHSVVVTMPTATGRLTVSGHDLVETERDARRETALDEAGRAAVLAERFGIRLAGPLRDAI
jgi:N-hydroxyarylamine O-acetyltransferase